MKHPASRQPAPSQQSSRPRPRNSTWQNALDQRLPTSPRESTSRTRPPCEGNADTSSYEFLSIGKQRERYPRIDAPARSRTTPLDAEMRKQNRRDRIGPRINRGVLDLDLLDPCPGDVAADRAHQRPASQ